MKPTTPPPPAEQHLPSEPDGIGLFTFVAGVIVLAVVAGVIVVGAVGYIGLFFH